MPTKKPKANKGQFVHLHVHTHYSLLDGMCKIPQLLEKAKEYNMPACAITDHGVMYGAIEFLKEARKRDIKPIIGCEMYVAPRKMTDKVPKIDTNPYHLVLLAKNEIGYHNLLKLVTESHIKGYYYKPRIDKEILAKHNEGLIALSSCIYGEIASCVLNKNHKEAQKALDFYRQLFGDDFYIELQYNPGLSDQEIVNDELYELAHRNKVKVVASKDVHYVDKEDKEAHEVLLCVQTGKTLNDEDRMQFKSDQSFLSSEEMIAAFSGRRDAIDNTLEIAEKCTFGVEYRLPFFDDERILIPKFNLAKGEKKRDYLEKKVSAGLKERYQKVTPKIRDRAAYELEVIERMKFEDYFLIVADFVNWAKKKGILVGPGRGSAAGSIVSYALGIVDIDPLKYDLLFERFLNPDRISMPDIDMDFADDRRNEVIEYVVKQYGKENVAQIITFGTMAARNAIRDTGRVLGMSYSEVDEVAKATPPNMPLSKSIKDVPELAAYYRQGGNYKKLLDLAQRLEGVARHSSTHAAGVVISEEPLVQVTPLQKAVKGDISWQTQYEMHAIEDLGLLKMDFLGLSNLTILKNTLRIIKKVYGEEIDLYSLSDDDKATYDLMSRGDTTGVFQLESSGMKRYLKELKPSCFEDVIAMVALYRPGPLKSGMVDEFIARKHGKKKITYSHPAMENALKDTYGVIVYQEQVMQLAKDMAGFTGGQADLLRKAMGKKIKDLMARMNNNFIQGCTKNGIDKKIAEKTWLDMEKFAEYGFNKSHAACYAQIAYWTAYLKAHYPDAFLASLMTSDYSDTERVAVEIAEAKAQGLEVLGPDINESFAEFGVAKGEKKIRYGLLAIKNVGSGIVEAILEARNSGGKFKNIEDFCSRVKASEINKKVMEALIKSGAMDSLEDRSVLLSNLNQILSFASRVQNGQKNGQLGLFGDGKESAIEHKLILESPKEPLSIEEKLSFEKELLGIYFSEHPLDSYAKKIESLNATPIANITSLDSGKRVFVCGVVTQVQKILTRNNDPMSFVLLEDKSGSIEVIIFPKIFEQHRGLIEEGRLLCVKGKVSTKDNQLKILVDSLEDLKDKLNSSSSVLSVSNTDFVQIDKDENGKAIKATIFVPSATTETDLAALRVLLSTHRGETETYVVLSSDGQSRKVKMPFGIDYSNGIVDDINALLSRRD